MEAKAVGNCRKAYWHMAKNGHALRAISKERLAQAGCCSILDRYESLHLCNGTAVYRRVRTVG